MTKQHSKQFKEDAVHYYENHKELGQKGCAKNLGIVESTFTKWLKQFHENGEVAVRGSRNYSSDEQKEIAFFQYPN